jgi:hypothetical protein
VAYTPGYYTLEGFVQTALQSITGLSTLVKLGSAQVLSSGTSKAIILYPGEMNVEYKGFYHVVTYGVKFDVCYRVEGDIALVVKNFVNLRDDVIGKLVTYWNPTSIQENAATGNIWELKTLKSDGDPVEIPLKTANGDVTIAAFIVQPFRLVFQDHAATRGGP